MKNKRSNVTLDVPPDEEQDDRPEPLPLGKRIRADPSYQKYRNVMEMLPQRFNLEHALTEAKSLYAQREVPRLPSVANADKVYSAQTKDMVLRARLTKIQMDLLEERSHLDTTLKAIRGHLRTTYAVEIEERAGKLVEERKAFVDRFLRVGIELHDRMETVHKIIDGFIKDIDQSGFGFTKLVDIIKLQTSRPGQVI